MDLRVVLFILMCEVIVLVSGSASPAFCENVNLLQNGGFEQLQDGLPAVWTLSDQTDTKSAGIELVDGRDGGRSVKISVGDFKTGDGVILLQDNAVRVHPRKYYQLTFWVRAEGMSSGRALIMCTDPWGEATRHAWYDTFSLTGKWTKFVINYRGTLETAKTRFEFVFNQKGTVWLDDVSLMEFDQGEDRNFIPTGDLPNFVRNSSFELGTQYWGTGNAEHLIWSIDSNTAWDGKSSLKMQYTAQTQPMCYEDWPIPYIYSKGPTLANIGWFELKKGQTYTISMYLKSDTYRLPVKIGLTNDAVTALGTVMPSEKWERHQVTVEAPAANVYLTLWPDLHSLNLDNATVWVDAVQIEQGASATPYKQRTGIEVSISTDRMPNLFYKDEDVKLVVRARNTLAEAANYPMKLIVRDFWGKQMFEKDLSQKIEPGQSLTIDVPTGIKGTGHFDAELTAGEGSEAIKHYARFGVIYPYAKTYSGKPSFFGINHSYWSDFKMDMTREIGTSYVRDWSLMWDSVEPERGKFDFKLADTFLNRIEDCGLIPFECLSQTSSRWATTMPEDKIKEGTGEGEPQYRWYPPQKPEYYQDHVRKVVGRYKGKIKQWEILNEPYWKNLGANKFTAKDVFDYLKLAYTAAKQADPNCVIIGGWSGPARQKDLLTDLFELGALKYMDAVNLHAYSALDEDEQLLEGYQWLNEMMAKYDKKKPIWVTEYGTYGTDVAMSDWYENMCVVAGCETERMVSESLVRQAAIGLGNGVECLVFHTGCWFQGVNSEYIPYDVVDYGGVPRKVYTAYNVMAWMLAPGSKFDKSYITKPVSIYCFTRGKQQTSVVWSDKDLAISPETWKELKQTGCTVSDIMGNPLTDAPSVLSKSPLYVVGTKDQMQKAVSEITAIAKH